MDRFGPTGKVSKKRVHLLRWTTFRGRTGWNFAEWIAPHCIFIREDRKWRVYSIVTREKITIAKVT